MPVQTLTLTLPDALFARLQQRARRTNRSVEDEVLDVVAAAIPVEDELPADLGEVLSPLALLDDESLWRAARSRLPPDLAAQLEELHGKRVRDGLTDSEAQTLQALVRQYERTMLIRARAAALLKQRGHDVTQLLASA
jgi:hypothetical protein